MLGILFFVVILGLAYWLLVRPILKQNAELAPFFTQADLIRAGWLARFHLMLSGLKTKLWSHFIILAGVLVPVLDMLGATDLASLLPPIQVTDTFQITPTQYVPAVVLPTIGFVSLKLRAVTTTPEGVPSQAQIAAIIPDAPKAVIEEKAAEIADAKGPPRAESGKD